MGDVMLMLAPVLRMNNAPRDSKPVPALDTSIEDYFYQAAVLQCSLGMQLLDGQEARSRHALCQQMLDDAVTSCALSRLLEMHAVRAGVASSILLSRVHNHCVLVGVCDTLIPKLDEELLAAEAAALAADED
jgi:hypothetical protein